MTSDFELVVEAKEYAFAKLDKLIVSKELYSDIFKVVYKAYIDGVDKGRKKGGKEE
ncbi:MAG: hypothetical protein J6V90_08370 [Treponema sp.]|nr:hypothetical protein [Treponema sp.]